MKNILVKKTAWVVLCLLVLVARPALGSDSETKIGSEEERLRRPRVLEVPERATIPIELPPEGALPSGAVETPPISVRRVELEGATLLPAEEAKRLTGPVENRTATLRELQEVGAAITRWYRGKGYVTSRAVVPAQEVKEGVVRIRVIEGRIGQVRVEGNKHFRTELLRRYVRVKSGESLWLPRLEEGLSLLNAHPDRKVKLVLAPAEVPETTDVVLQVEDHEPLHASWSVDTLGGKATGQIRQSLIVSHGNLTGDDDQILVRGLISEFGGVKGAAMSYLRPISESGLAATLDVSGVQSSVGGDLKGLLARGNAVTVSPGLLVPLIRKSRWELEGTTGLEFKRIRTYLDDISSSKDDLRVVRAGTNFLQEDRWGRGLAIQEVHVGVPNVLGGSHPEDVAASRAGAGGSFVRWVFNGVRVQRGPWDTSLVFRGAAQLTSNRLVAAEQFRLGGFDTVRGYPEGEYLADYGFQATVEARVPLKRLVPVAFGSGDTLRERLRKSVLLVGFWDFAEGFLRGPRSGEDADMRLNGVGCGLRVRPTSESVLQADWGWAIGDADSEKDRPRLHLICRIGF